ncbi:MAG: ribonuclease HIII [Chlamydiales bacterium]
MPFLREMLLSSFVVQVNLAIADKLLEGIKDQGFNITYPPHTVFQGKKKGVSCTLFTSGKLLVQGNQMREFIEFYLEPEILHTFTLGYEEHQLDLTPRIGVDESGKGDYFGPLCVAGVYADEKQVIQLQKLGVKDSKKLKDTALQKIAKIIRKDYLSYVVHIGPKRYNELYEKFGNLNLLLGWGHATVIENLLEKTECRRVIIDQFAAEHVVENALKRKKKQALLIQRPRGEEDLAVAAASILARASFLDGLEGLEKKWSMIFPKGASQQTIQAGKRLVRSHSPQILNEVGKLHFKTTEVILEQD